MGKLIEIVGKIVQVDGGGLGVRVLGTLDWGKAGDVGEFLDVLMWLLYMPFFLNIRGRLTD